MNHPQKPVLKTVAAYEKTAGMQDAEHFREQLVLQLSRRNVMQHGE
jgi:hypothetical protein